MWQTILSNYISSSILMLGILIYGKIIFSKKVNSSIKYKIILFVTASLIHTLTFNIFSGTIKTLLMTFTNIVFYKMYFNLSYSKSILVAFIYMIVLIVPDVLLMIILVYIFNLRNFYYNYFAGSLLCNFIVVIGFIGFVYLIRKPLRKLISIKIEENNKIILYCIFTFVCFAIFAYKAFSNILLNINFIVSIFVMITFLAILGSLIKQILDNNRLTREYDNLLEFMTTYENEIENQRILRHETKNEFLTIRAKLCDNQKNKEIVNYIDELLKDKIQVKQEEYAKFGYLPANGIKGLCYFKVREAENKGINIALNISKKVKTSPINNLNVKEQKDFGRILGVLLDNAIEASINSKDKKIGIEFYSKSKDDFKMIISNTFDNNIDKDKIGKERFSTKGKNRGHGLLLVKQIINNNSMYELKTNIIENLYIQTITIKKV